jgi:hypothetical protein
MGSKVHVVTAQILVMFTNSTVRSSRLTCKFVFLAYVHAVRVHTGNAGQRKETTLKTEALSFQRIATNVMLSSCPNT